jgi:exosortase B
LTSVVATAAERPQAPGRVLLSHWPLLVGLLILGIPTLISLGKQTWSTEAGAHGPIVLATGIWLLWGKTEEFRTEGRPGAPWLTALILAVSLALYVFGRPYDFISLEVAGFYGVCLAMLHSYVGLPAMLRNWFPLLYLGFVVPPPGWAIDAVTIQLKEFVSYAATHILSFFGVPITREGVTLQVAQYQLLVEDACSGMNSLVGLIAISLFYIYLVRKASWRYSVVLVSLVVPIAILANIIRIIVLVLLTYFFGDAVAQGFLHKTAGLFLFGTALALVFAVDHLASGFIERRRAKA